jgi:hypothetical protein
VRNGSVTPREESFAKQTQVMLLGRWCTEDVAYSDFEIGVKFLNWSPASGVTLEKGASNLYSNFLRPGWSEHESESRRHQRVRGLTRVKMCRRKSGCDCWRMARQAEEFKLVAAIPEDSPPL